jgi:trans-aconitate methyltransferase
MSDTQGDSRARVQAWDARGYEQAFGYVSGFGASLVELLDPRPGERVLDLGSGTGTLAAEIAARGAEVSGIDGDARMVEQASAAHPQIPFTVADAHTFTLLEPVDAVFSNAALHWMLRPREVVARVHAALRPGGRFVAEMGAGSNMAVMIDGLRAACAEHGQALPPLPWYFPTPAEYAAVLEDAGFEVRVMHYFPRPTPLAPGTKASGWWRMFGPSVLARLPGDAVDPILARADELVAPLQVGEDGVWYADYVRLRFAALRLPLG